MMLLIKLLDEALDQPLSMKLFDQAFRLSLQSSFVNEALDQALSMKHRNKFLGET
jgi:hypothetical protein